MASFDGNAGWGSQSGPLISTDNHLHDFIHVDFSEFNVTSPSVSDAAYFHRKIIDGNNSLTYHDMTLSPDYAIQN